MGLKHRIARLEALVPEVDHFTVFNRYNETGETPTDKREFEILIEFQGLLIGMAQGHIRENDFNVWPGVRLFYERKSFFQTREFKKLDADILSDGAHFLKNGDLVVYCERPGFPGELPAGESVICTGCEDRCLLDFNLTEQQQIDEDEAVKDLLWGRTGEPHESHHQGVNNAEAT